ncbi:PH domain-containing protein [Halorhodospira abdelmalekii]|uniref:PH domain-containing protein n=1 Tax=Halorhodospira abdelmalekii TaxID=421629 RepID=UPI0019089025|nr:PH domain-containing protein [Halorhodospira abdelmalekii]
MATPASDAPDSDVKVIRSAYRSPVVAWGLIAAGILVILLWLLSYQLHAAEGYVFSDIAAPFFYFVTFSAMLILGGIFLIIFTTHSWRCRIESDGVVLYQGFLGKPERTDIKGSEMKEVFCRRGMIASMLGVGDIWIKTPDDKSHVLPGVTNPDAIIEQLRAIQEQKGRR